MNNFKLLKTYTHLPDAELDFIKLKDEGLKVYMTDSNTTNIIPYNALAIGGIKIYIDENDFEQGQKIVSYEVSREGDLKEFFEGEELEPELRCPNCGSINVFQERSVLSGILFLILFFLPVSIAKNTYHCSNCDNKWKRR